MSDEDASELPYGILKLPNRRRVDLLTTGDEGTPPAASLSVEEVAEALQVPDPPAFGDCPQCGRNDGYLNDGRDHWCICHVHKVKWYMGTNLFSSWTLETEETRNKNKALLSGYTEVDPIKGGDSTCLPQPS